MKLTLPSGSGRDIAEIFEELPDRKLFSDYYQAIAQPISLAEIEVSLRQAHDNKCQADPAAGEDGRSEIRDVGSVLG